MFNITGIDCGAGGTRQVSLGMLWGSPVREDLGGRKVASVPSDILTFRKVGLPPAGREVCRRVVQEELAYSLPFPLEDAAWDYSGSSGQEAWVVVAPLQRLADIRRLVGDTAALDAEPLCYLRAASSVGLNSALVIDLGSTKTTICALLPGQLEWVRVMLRGGRALTARIAKARGCSLEQAEELKREQGCELEPCRIFVSELFDELGLADPFPYDRILLCGGGAAMAGLPAMLKQRFKVEAELFPLPAPLSPFEDVVAYGAALSERLGQPKIRLVSMTTGGLEVSRARHWSGVGIMALFCMLLLGFQTETRLSTLRERQAVQSAALQDLLKGHAGVAKQKDPTELSKTLKAEIVRRKALQSVSLQNVIDTLARAAGPVRKILSSDVRSMAFDGSKFHMEGQAASLKDTQRLREALSKLFGNVEQAKSRPGDQGRYVYEFDWKLPDQ
jgi:hypothetical protein